MHRFGLHFLVANDWDPGVRQIFGAAAFIFGTAVTSFGALLIAGPLSIAMDPPASAARERISSRPRWPAYEAEGSNPLPSSRIRM